MCSALREGWRGNLLQLHLLGAIPAGARRHAAHRLVQGLPATFFKMSMLIYTIKYNIN